jgi:hypothetical protein
LYICGVFRENDKDGGPLPIEPTMTLATSPGKSHDWLLAAEPWPLGDLGSEAWKAVAEEFTGMMRRMILDHGSDPDAKDLARVLRLAGFNNLKDPDHPFLVNIVNVSGTRYARADLVKTFPPISSSSGGDRKRKAKGAGNGAANGAANGTAHGAGARASMGTLYDDDGTRPYTKRAEIELRSATRFIAGVDRRTPWVASCLAFLRLRWPEYEKGGGPAFDIWHELCERSDKYEGIEECRALWETNKKYIDDYRTDNNAVIASVFKEAYANGFKFPYWQEDYEGLSKLEDRDDIDRFNTDWALIEKIGAMYSFKHSSLFSPDKFKLVTANLKRRPKDDDDGGDKKPKLLSGIWLGSTRRPAHAELTFEPSEPRVTRSNKLNLFKGFPVKPKEGDVTLFKEMVLHNVGGNEDQAHYLTCFMAHIIQMPWKKLMVSPFIMSETTGNLKSTLPILFGKLLGEYFVVATVENLKSRFNSWMEGKLLIFVDETVVSDKRGLVEKMKFLITSPVVPIEKKGIDMYNVANYANFWHVSNKSDGILIEEQDRRFFAARATEEKKAAKPYFSWWNNGGDAAVMHYLMNYDLSGFDPYAEAMVTQFKREIISDARNETQKIIHKLREDCEGKPLRTLQDISALISKEDDFFNKNKRYLASELRNAQVVQFHGDQGQLQLPNRIIRKVYEVPRGQHFDPCAKVLSTDPDTGVKTVKVERVIEAGKITPWAVADYAHWRAASTADWVAQWLHQEGAERIDGRHK